MSSQFPYSILPWLCPVFLDGNGDPVANGLLYSTLAGTTTPSALFADPGGTTPLPNPVQLDANGRLFAFIPPIGLRFDLHDSDDVPVSGYPIDYVTNLAALLQVRLSGAAGARSVTSGYTVLAADDLVTIDGTGGASPCILNLPAAVDRSLPIILKNLSATVAVRVTPAGVDTIENGLATYTIPVSVSPKFPTVTVHSDGISAWFIVGALGI